MANENTTPTTTTTASKLAKVPLPTLFEGASLKLNDTHSPSDHAFYTQIKADKDAGTKGQYGPPVDAVCVDHCVVSNDKGNDSLRCLFVVVRGTDFTGKIDLTGRNIVADLGLGEGSEPYTLATLRLMNFNFDDVDAAVEALAKNPNDPKAQKAAEAAEAAFLARYNDSSKSGAGTKIMHVKVEQETYKGKVSCRVPLSGITQPAAKLSDDEVKKKMGSGLLARLAASKAGAPKKDFSGGGAGQGNGTGGKQTRNPSSPPPVIDKGTIAPDTEMIF